MYSPALVTLHNIVRELGHGKKKMSEKGIFPKSMGQQLCFHFQQTYFDFKKKTSNFFFFKKNQNQPFPKKKKSNFQKKNKGAIDRK